ncbi:MAG TPA: chorismate mutase [Gemmatimonadaceae bacterium]|nr:chorismate mutase [Gemmatimonadaceae bacterium]
MDNRARVRALRGATTVERDAPADIRTATRELLEAIVERNSLDTGDIISAIFTVTSDLRSEFPARAARELGWHDIPLLCTVEIPVPGALDRCIRVLLHAEIAMSRDAMRHVYLRGARALRPDLLAD